MSDPVTTPDKLNNDEKRLIRLFHCLDNDGRSEMLQRLGKRLIMEAALDPHLNYSRNPEEAAKEELHEGIDDRLKRLCPIHSDLLDLLDYDFNVTEYGWQDAGVSIAEVILGSDQNDDEFAEMLVDAYLDGAKRYDVPLPCDFADAEVSKDAAIEEMRQDLQGKALSFIKEWRENVLRRFEQGP
jgi:hypothetical protein